MSNGLVARQLEQLFRHGIDPQGDRALVDRFVSGGDESAFEALVTRHGPMVRGVCLRLLGSPHDADDAFQATFLVLVQKANRLRDADHLGPWLYGVATRVATRARVRESHRRNRFEFNEGEVPARDGGVSPEWLDVRPILDAELLRLPAKYRDVLIICLLEGFTAEEAARQLACPLGTVKSRLARGREALRARLTGRGLAPAAVVAVLASSRSVVASPVSETLYRTTLKVVVARTAITPSVVALTRGAVPSMLSKSTVMAAVVLGGVTFSGLGLANWMKSPAQAQDPGEGAAAGAQAPGERAPDAGPPSARQQARAMSHMKLMMLAFHNYASANDTFPPAAIYGADGRPKLSWRVALLPYLAEGKLFEEFHKDEAWDSPHNKALIARMPAVFSTPNAPAPAGKTRIQGFHGKGAFFDGVKGQRLADITDGTSNTVVLGLAKDAVNWTEPADMPFDEAPPQQVLTDAGTNGYLLAMADGSVHTLPKDTPVLPGLLRAMITRSGGEVIQIPVNPTPPTGTTKTTVPRNATPAPGISASPPIPPALEERLQRLEDKLDRILRKFDAAGPTTPGEGAKP